MSTATREEQGGESAEEATRKPMRGGGRFERLLGVPADSPAAVTVVVLGSVLLAGLVVRYPRPIVVAAVAGLAAGATVFDVAEVSHQVAADRTGVAVLAALVYFISRWSSPPSHYYAEFEACDQNGVTGTTAGST
jgi:hypothetical protein